VKKTTATIALVLLILLTIAAWYAAFRLWKKNSNTAAAESEGDNPFANAKTKNVRFHGAPWWKEVDRIYKTKSGAASAIVERLIKYYRENTESHEAILETQDVHQSADPAYLLVLYAFNAAVEEGMIELRQFQSV